MTCSAWYSELCIKPECRRLMLPTALLEAHYHCCPLAARPFLLQLGPAGGAAWRCAGRRGSAPPPRRGVQFCTHGGVHHAVCCRPAVAGPQASAQGGAVHAAGENGYWRAAGGGCKEARWGSTVQARQARRASIMCWLLQGRHQSRPLRRLLHCGSTAHAAPAPHPLLACAARGTRCRCSARTAAAGWWQTRRS